MPEFGFTSSFSALSYEQDKGVEIGVNKLLVSAGLFLFASTSLSFPQPVFAPPVNVGPPINTAAHESDPFLTSDGKKLFFVRDSDIWYAEWNGAGWNTPVKLGPQINSGPGIDHSPSVSPDGQMLYFVPDLRDGFLWDIWVSTFDSLANDWGTPVNLGWPVNTPGEEFSAHIGHNERRLYFSSASDSVDSLNPSGRCGLYFSGWDGANWSIPIKLAPNLNTCFVSQYPSITADGKWFYFSSYVSDGTSTFVSESTSSGWGSAIDLRPQIDGRSGTPFITASGESLFFAGSPTDFGGFGGSDIWMSELISLDVKDGKHSPLPRTFELYQNYPNPFNSRTKISFFVSQRVREPVDLTVFNLLGSPVRRLLENRRLTGSQEIEWDGTDDDGKEVSSGIYLIRLRVGDFVETKKMQLVK